MHAIGLLLWSLFMAAMTLAFMAFTTVIALIAVAMLEDQLGSRGIAQSVGPHFDLSVLVGTIIIAALSGVWAVYHNGFPPAPTVTRETYMRSISGFTLAIAGSAMLLFFSLMLLGMFQRM